MNLFIPRGDTGAKGRLTFEARSQSRDSVAPPSATDEAGAGAASVGPLRPFVWLAFRNREKGAANSFGMPIRVKLN
jgi:hypothetical protein